MFKIICNVGRWETLFEAKNASKSLKDFMLANAESEGREGAFTIRNICRVQDAGRWGGRPRFIKLVTERLDLTQLISISLKLEAGSTLEQICIAKDLTEVRSQVADVVRYCGRLEESLPAREPVKREHLAWTSGISLTIFLLLLWCLPIGSGTYLLVQQRFVQKKESSQLMSLAENISKLGSGIQNLSNHVEILSNRVEKLQAVPPKAATDPKYIVIRDTAEAIGDIVLASGQGFVPEGFRKCNGDKITRDEYPDFFKTFDVFWNTTKLPDISAPPGKVYLIRVK